MFVLVPLAEIVVILQVGAAIGGWWTTGLLVADSLLGAWLLKVEGRRAWGEFRTALAEGRWPGDEVAQGALVIVGGTLLLTPGFLTDVVGFLFLLGPTRRIVASRIRARVSRGTVGGSSTGSVGGGGRTGGGASGGPGGSGPGGASGGPGGSGPGGADGSRGAGAGGSGGRRRPVRGEDVDLDVEVVEVRREQRHPEAPDADADTGEDVAADDGAVADDEDGRTR